MTVTLVLGGARSGKSRYAETIAIAAGRELVYIATARAGTGDDSEMGERIAHHRASRDTRWRTVEEPLQLGEAILRASSPASVVLVDCLTLWLTNLVFSDGRIYPDLGRIDLPAAFHDQRAQLLSALEQASGDVILVSNEVGMGIVPMGAVTRSFVDEAGRLNQAVAALADRVIFVAAGLPLMLKGGPC